MISENPIADIDDHKATQLSPEGEIAVGRIAVWASLLERNLEELAQRLSNFSSSEMTSPGSRAIKVALKYLQSSDTLTATDSTRIKKLLAESRRLLKTRNSVVHAIVGNSTKPGAVTFRNNPKNPDLILTDEDLDRLAKQLHSIAWEVFDCSMTVARAPGKSTIS